MQFTVTRYVYIVAKLAFKTRPLPSYDLVSGISATIPCVFAKIPAAVNWEIETEDNKRTVVTGTSKDFSVSQTGLTILSVSPDLEGATLKCIGRNELESASATTYIRMVYGMLLLMLTCLYQSMLLLLLL